MNNMKEIPSTCPSCNSDMRVCMLKCPTCGIEIQGDFDTGRFSFLTDSQTDFLELFIKSRGSLKDVGKLLNISYPTARNRLDDLVGAFEAADKEVVSTKRIEILEMVKAGEITIEEALEKLR